MASSNETVTCHITGEITDAAAIMAELKRNSEAMEANTKAKNNLAFWVWVAGAIMFPVGLDAVLRFMLWLAW